MLPATSSYEIQIEPGKIHYFGKVEAIRKVGPNPPEIRVGWDRDAEKEAWSKVLGKFPTPGAHP